MQLNGAVREAEPGTKLPSGSALAAHFGVARMTVQSAISELARDGLVTGQQGSGVFVSSRTSMGAFDVAEIVRWAARARLLPDPDRLPDASEIAAQQGVSADTAQRALDLLHAEGLPRTLRTRSAEPAGVPDPAASVVRAAVVAVEAADDVVARLPSQRSGEAARPHLRDLITGVHRLTARLTQPTSTVIAPALAAKHLAAALPRRWRHVEAGGVRADRIAEHLTAADARALRDAAWLHDIGYAPDLAETGFHPLDGARFLDRVGADSRVVALVANHSAAVSEAAELGLADELAVYTDERSLVRDLLWWCDMTVGPDGQAMTFGERMDEVCTRYGPDHYVTRAMTAGMPERTAALDRATAWLDEQGIPHP